MAQIPQSNDFAYLNTVTKGTKFLLHQRFKSARKGNIDFVRLIKISSQHRECDTADVVKSLNSSHKTTKDSLPAPPPFCPPKNKAWGSKETQPELVSHSLSQIKKKKKKRKRKRKAFFALEPEPMVSESKAKRIRAESNFLSLPTFASDRNRYPEIRPCNEENYDKVKIPRTGGFLKTIFHQSQRGKICESKEKDDMDNNKNNCNNNNRQELLKWPHTIPSKNVRSYFSTGNAMSLNNRGNIFSPNSTGTTTQSLIQNRDHRGKCTRQPSPVPSLPFSLSDLSVPNNISPVESTKIWEKVDSNSNILKPPVITISSDSNSSSSLSTYSRPKLPPAKEVNIKPKEKSPESQHPMTKPVQDKEQHQEISWCSENLKSIHFSSWNKEYNSRLRLRKGVGLYDNANTLPQVSRQIMGSLQEGVSAGFSSFWKLPQHENILSDRSKMCMETHLMKKFARTNLIEYGSTKRTTLSRDVVSNVHQNSEPNKMYPEQETKQNKMMESMCSMKSNFTYHTCLSTADLSLPLTPDKESICDTSTESDGVISCQNSLVKVFEGCVPDISSHSSTTLVNALQSKKFSEKNEYLNEETKKCLAKIIQTISTYYGASLTDCVAALERNCFNILTTLQEMQFVIPSSEDNCVADSNGTRKEVVV